MRESVTPWGLLTRADDLRRGFIENGPDVAELWTHCTGCGACTAHCKHENPVAETIFALRGMARKGGFEYPELDRWAHEDVDHITALVNIGRPHGKQLVLPGASSTAEIEGLVGAFERLGLNDVRLLSEEVSAHGLRLYEVGRHSEFFDYLEQFNQRAIRGR